MATAADYVIAEVEQLVEVGDIPPDEVHTPGIFVDAIFEGQQLREAHRETDAARAFGNAARRCGLNHGR